MFQKILLPSDLNDLNTRAVQLAVELATVGGATVTVIHAIQTIQDTPFEELVAFYDKLERRATERLAQLRERFAAAGVECRPQVVYGDRTAEIVKFAKEQGIDLIVIQSHQISKESGWASLSHKIGVLAPCPVLLVR